MADGEYEFGTSTVEHMTVTSGVLTVLLPGSDEWQDYCQGQTFVVESGVKFKVKTKSQVSYLCLYK